MSFFPVTIKTGEKMSMLSPRQQEVLEVALNSLANNLDDINDAGEADAYGSPVITTSEVKSLFGAFGFDPPVGLRSNRE